MEPLNRDDLDRICGVLDDLNKVIVISGTLTVEDSDRILGYVKIDPEVEAVFCQKPFEEGTK